jgi:hypothetical protein
VSAELEDLVPGTVIGGVVPAKDVTSVALSWHGSSAVTLTYRDPDGRVGERLLYRSDEATLQVRGAGSRFGFDADGELFTLVSEARRIRLAHLFDPLLAVHLSLVEPLPHQIRAVYGELLPRQPLRFVLADDPGAGKTIMAGLYIKELLLRSDVARCLVVAPGGLVAQWQDELAEKFSLDFTILTRDAIEASHTGNPLAERDLVIARLDHLSRNDDIQERLKATEWDLVVVDEAHRMSAHYEGDDVRETRRYRLGKLLSATTRHLLLLTATPHAGKDEDFQLFLALLDQDRFEGRRRSASGQIDTTDLMRRMVKEKLLRFDGRPLFPERRAYSVPFELSAAEQDLYEAVTTYVTQEMKSGHAGPTSKPSSSSTTASKTPTCGQRSELLPMTVGERPSCSMTWSASTVISSRSSMPSTARSPLVPAISTISSDSASRCSPTTSTMRSERPCRSSRRCAPSPTGFASPGRCDAAKASGAPPPTCRGSSKASTRPGDDASSPPFPFLYDPSTSSYGNVDTSVRRDRSWIHEASESLARGHDRLLGP